MIRVIDLTFDYQSRLLLANFNMHVNKYELIHLKGANGSGKTTLLKLIAGLLRPHEGHILFENNCIFKDPYSYFQNLLYIGHKPGINPWLTFKENCYFNLYGRYFCKNTFEEFLKLFKLETICNQRAGILSAGQRKKMALARLWLSPAKLWILDEPLNALDDQSCSIVMNKIGRHCENGGAVIISSHQKLPSTSSSRDYCL